MDIAGAELAYDQAKEGDLGMEVSTQRTVLPNLTLVEIGGLEPPTSAMRTPRSPS